MALVLKADCSVADAYVKKTGLNGYATPWYATYEIAMPTATATSLNSGSKDRSAGFHEITDASNLNSDSLCGIPEVNGSGPWDLWGYFAGVFFTGTFSLDDWHTVEIQWDGTTISVSADSILLNSYAYGATPFNLYMGGRNSYHVTSEIYYIKTCVIGSTPGGSDLFTDGFSGGDFSHWSTTSGSVSLVDDPLTPAAAPSGRVLIAWDDAPLEPNPTWTAIDQGGSTFPHDFVSGYDTHSGRQTLISQTETGTATVYVNDRSGLFDDRNGSSPFQGKLSGRQIMLQLYNPVDATWEPQFRGLIDDYRYTMDGSAVGADGQPVNASIEIDCVDVFDYLNGYGLTPGVDGTTPPAGAEDSVYFAASGVSDTVEDRILEILGNANIDPTMSITASGNIKVIATQYNADESALTALRDAADAELPFIGNIYCNRSGQFCFRGRYSAFAPDDVAAEAGSTWDFTRWKVGDGKAIGVDPTRAQIRLLSYSRDRADIINAAMCYPQGTPATAIPDQVYANSASITAYGKHQANPFTDLITSTYVGPGTISPDDGQTQCYMYAELLVKNKKDPRLCPTAVQLKSINPTDFRASATWGMLTRSDISHIVNIAVGYAGGTGLLGGATVDDYYIQGRNLTVRPANSAYDYIELELDVTPFEWSADTHGVFPAFGT